MTNKNHLARSVRIDSPGGAVTRFVRSDDPDFRGFGEVYFSTIESGAIKAWRRHGRASLVVTVVFGEVLFVLRDTAATGSYILNAERPERLTIPPGSWFGFAGLFPATSIVCSFSNMVHDPAEVERVPSETFPYDWRLS